jgi:Protein of unknown function (DUF3072)
VQEPTAAGRAAGDAATLLSPSMAGSNPTQPNPEKDPDEWVTGEEPATGPQLSYLDTLAQQAGTELPDELTKAQAPKLIDELQARTGRGGDPTAT